MIDRHAIALSVAILSAVALLLLPKSHTLGPLSWTVIGVTLVSSLTAVIEIGWSAAKGSVRSEQTLRKRRSRDDNGPVVALLLPSLEAGSAYRGEARESFRFEIASSNLDGIFWLPPQVAESCYGTSSAQISLTVTFQAFGGNQQQILRPTLIIRPPPTKGPLGVLVMLNATVILRFVFLAKVDAGIQVASMSPVFVPAALVPVPPETSVISIEFNSMRQQI